MVNWKHTNIVSAHISCLGANGVIRQRRSVGLLAQGDLILTSVWHCIGKFHVVIDRLVDLFIESSKHCLAPLRAM